MLCTLQRPKCLKVARECLTAGKSVAVGMLALACFTAVQHNTQTQTQTQAQAQTQALYTSQNTKRF